MVFIVPLFYHKYAYLSPILENQCVKQFFQDYELSLLHSIH